MHKYHNEFAFHSSVVSCCYGYISEMMIFRKRNAVSAKEEVEATEFLVQT